MSTPPTEMSPITQVLYRASASFELFFPLMLGSSPSSRLLAKCQLPPSCSAQRHQQCLLRKFFSQQRLQKARKLRAMSLVVYCGFKLVESLGDYFQLSLLRKGRLLLINNHVFGVREVDKTASLRSSRN
ncbi:hypothetical protein MRX96_050338 [Rhipicephalus microplus]